MNTAHKLESPGFTRTLKRWRKQRKMSQLDLALTADVSQKHVSWLETGRSHPSREMVVRLADAMEIPLRDRNGILNSAGFANMYTKRDLNAPELEPINHILSEMLLHHEPYPAFVLDRQWNIKMKNEAADLLFEVVGDPEKIWGELGQEGELNIALLTVHPKGMRRFIANWSEVVSPFMRRLRKEAVDSGDADMMVQYQRLAELAGKLDDTPSPHDGLPLLPLEINLGGPTLKLCSVISTFGTAQDITTDELRIETFYPADDVTRKFFAD